jgi:hypothetical protein
LANVALKLKMAHLSASEVYVNSKLIRRFNVVSKTRAEETAYMPPGILLQAGMDQIIAVQYSTQQVTEVNYFLNCGDER